MLSPPLAGVSEFLIGIFTSAGCHPFARKILWFFRSGNNKKRKEKKETVVCFPRLRCLLLFRRASFDVFKKSRLANFVMVLGSSWWYIYMFRTCRRTNYSMVFLRSQHIAIKNFVVITMLLLMYTGAERTTRKASLLGTINRRTTTLDNLASHLHSRSLPKKSASDCLTVWLRTFALLLNNAL